MHPSAAGTASALAAALLLGACASSPLPGPAAMLPVPHPAAPAAWQAPLPTEAPAGTTPALDDPALPALVQAAVGASASLSQAQTRVAQARAARVAAAAALQLQVSAGASASRARSDPATPPASMLSGTLEASWELDLFGAAAASRTAAQARLVSATVSLQAARLVLGAETAVSLVELRACEAQTTLAAGDAASRAETARLTELAERAGFRAPADAALARASAAQGRNAEAERRAQCALLLKSLVELTALDEAALRALLAPATGRLPGGSAVPVTSLPAALLQQRPDVVAASQAVVAAAADTRRADADRFPQLRLAGSIGGVRMAGGGDTRSGATWSLGPLSVSLPVFDGGRREADLAAARASYDDAVVQLQASLRGAVREVEQALVRLDSTARRRDDARIAAEGFDAASRAAEARWRGGLGSLFELEDARRSALAARAALIELERERLAAWIALHRALGGGWSAAPLNDPSPPAPAAAAR